MDVLQRSVQVSRSSRIEAAEVPGQGMIVIAPSTSAARRWT